MLQILSEGFLYQSVLAVDVGDHCVKSSFPALLHGQSTGFLYLLNNSGKLNDSWRKRFLPSVEMTASFVIPNECEESRFMLRIS